MADKYLNLTGLQYLWNKIQSELNNKDKVDIYEFGSTTYSEVQSNISNDKIKGISLNGNAYPVFRYVVGTNRTDFYILQYSNNAYQIIGLRINSGDTWSYFSVEDIALKSDVPVALTAGDGIDITRDIVSNTKPMNYSITAQAPSATPINADLLQGHNASYFQQALTAGDGISLSGNVINSFTERDLLWTNSSTTAAFAPQTLTLDLSQYKLILIQFRISTTTSSYVVVPFVPTGYDQIAIGKGQSNPTIFTRLLTVRQANVQFYAAYSSQDSSNPLNTTMIPFRIYGIK